MSDAPSPVTPSSDPMVVDLGGCHRRCRDLLPVARPPAGPTPRPPAGRRRGRARGAGPSGTSGRGAPARDRRRGPLLMDARELQHALAEIGWPLDVDGNVGPQTRRAVADFQRGYAWAPLDADGVAGP